MRGAATPTPRATGAPTAPLRSLPDAPSRSSSSCSPPSAPSLPPPRSPDPRPHPRPHLRPPPLALSTRGPGPRQFFGPTISSLVAPNPRFSFLLLLPSPWHPSSRPCIASAVSPRDSRPCRPIVLPPSPFPTPERRAIRLFLSSTLFSVFFSPLSLSSFFCFR